jgi:hypothetical protein
MATGGGRGDLPLIGLPAARQPAALALILSGDGGWRDVGRAIGQTLSQGDIAVVGLNSRRYFWKARTPEQVARDMYWIVEHYQSVWRVDDVLLIGYSFGGRCAAGGLRSDESGDAFRRDAAVAARARPGCAIRVSRRRLVRPHRLGRPAGRSRSRQAGHGEGAVRVR